ncbi:MAG: 30S ribosomal protein S8 [Pseudomonadota bacterium]|jgi:small subunit ribosomal protein S8|uniref:30S ribosomal subunit protein S8 n=1 Tax=anaerobic digester metagenome TaxID=1263854 RepID=A0A485LWN1_9ZZZZ|nr:30S ribosomal protein S8 [Pseudomonadota bacterium]HON39761.1 30S ribosomal protein S8 [Deltaproteobacteria bacterium]HRS57253.1 30S ribosomal protein S8 [Desulfomonilia bacterium]HPD22306.1 30S ribosomal protein S8 [Deltaproteobacteria bacterium]HPX19317.1 30S ribosomal protein S8 [Deltaproteobacteria bacterium]
MHTDPIADMITRIKNGAQASKESVDIPASRMKLDILDILMKEGYIKGFKVIDDGKQGLIRVNLKYFNSKHVITDIRRVSKPGRRIYRKADDIQQVRRGLGISIVSTSRGIMTDRKAKANNVGGEELLRVW